MIFIGQDVEITAEASGGPESAPLDLKFYIQPPTEIPFSVVATLADGKYTAIIRPDESGLWTIDARASLPSASRQVAYMYVNTAPLVIAP